MTRSELRGNLGWVLAHSTPPSGHWESQVSLEIAYCGELRRLGDLHLIFTSCTALCPLFELSTPSREKRIVEVKGCGADKQADDPWVPSLIDRSINDVKLANGASKPNPIVRLFFKDWPIHKMYTGQYLSGTLVVTLLY